MGLKHLVYTPVGQISRVFANGPGDRCSIPGRDVSKTQKMVLDAANGPGDWGSIPGRDISKTQKMVLDAALQVKNKVEQSSEWSGAPLLIGVVAIEKREFESPSTKVVNFTFFTL